VDVAKYWSRRGNSYDLKLEGVEHSQFVRNAIWDTGPADDYGDADTPETYVLFEPIGGPVAAKGGKKGGGGNDSGSNGSAPSDITLTNDSVDENSIGGTVIGTLGAVDADSRERFTFTLLDDAGGLFAISGKNKLVVADGAEIDYEAGATRQITVLVTDKKGNTYQETMTISVNNLTETPNTQPTEITLSNMAVDENSAGGTVIGTLGTNDTDAGDSWTYVITLDPDQKFQIIGGQLVLRNGAALDYETAMSHSVTIQVTDSTGASFFETFTIGVNDVFEAVNSAPTDMDISGNSVTEGAANGTLVGVLTTIDPDSGESFTYTLLDSAGGRFTLDGDRLEIANDTLIDFETDPSHTVTVQVTDSAGNTYDETFTIQVQDVAGPLAEQPGYIQALIPAVNGEAYYFWPDGDTGTAPTTITFAILTDFPSYYDPSNMFYTDYTSGAVSFDQLTAAQLSVISQLLGEIEDFANVEFVEVGSASQANITFGMYYQDSGIGAYAWYPSASGSEGTVSGDIWLNSRYDTSPTTDDTIGADWARSTISHELGHAMGLKHPGDYNAGGGGTPGPYLDAEVDNNQYTVMSYNDFPYSGADPTDYMLYDIATLQYLYGANTNYAAGDDVYVFNTSSNLIDTIWDAGGFDTFSAAGATTAVTIDLNQGGFSSIGLTNNIAIAYGAEIEAAVGGSKADTLIGNSLGNSFTGGGGADTFVFADNWGSDIVLDFQDGLDTLDLSGTGLLYADLSIGNGVSGAEIASGGSTLVLAGIDASLVDDTDFVFV
jgi:hypothetical protein